MRAFQAQLQVFLWVTCFFCLLLNVDRTTSASASSSPFSASRWASTLQTRPTRLDSSGFSLSVTSRTNTRLQQHSRRSSLVNRHEEEAEEEGFFEDLSSACRRRMSSSSSSSSSSSLRGGAAAIAMLKAKTMTARQMELFNLLSGGVAGTIAACLTNPLEVIKTQLQSSNTAVTSPGSSSALLANGRGHPMTVATRIFEADGIAGFFRGLTPTLVGIIPSRSAYFYAYHRSKHALEKFAGLKEGSPPNALVSGLLAGIVGNTLTNPIWMVRTRMQILADASAGQVAYKGYADAIRTIFREEGLGGFYKGIRASYWGCAEGSIQFIIYEQLKTKLQKRHNAHRAKQGLPATDTLPVATYFWSAALAKMLASIATYPHEVARTRMREQARAGVFKYKGMWQTLGVILREEGRQGLYSGLGVHLLKVVPNSAFMFLTYEVVRMWLGEFTVVEEFEEREETH